MEKQLFATRLREAALAARDFAGKFIEEPLPNDLRFRLRLNSSYDGNPRVGDEVVYPDDRSYEKANAVRNCSEEQVVETLWRDGRVPEWIDVCVIGETGITTLIQLLCCGRFTAEEQRLYHQREGRPPFHMTSPAHPPQYRDGQRFSIHLRSECWTREDVGRLRAHAAKVWSLQLMGHAMDDHTLRELPDLAHMEILELNYSALRGVGLVDLARHKKLRVLRIRLDRPDEFAIPELPLLRTVEHLDLENLPTRPWGSAHVFRAVPKLSWLTLKTRGDLYVDGVCPARTSQLTVDAKRLVGSFRPPEVVDSLSLHVEAMTVDEISAWLRGVRRVSSLQMRGTPLSDAYAEELPAKYGLTYLGIVDTGVSETAVARIAAAHPALRMHPNLNARTS